MVAQEITSTQVNNSAESESILVVKRIHLFPQEAWYGLRLGNFSDYLSIITSKKEFLPRDQMEENPDYKQIIPYLIFMHDEKLFVMQRKATASETRLQNKYTLGIGGHIRAEDMKKGDLFDWANREFHEEVVYNDTMTIEPFGVLNDDTNPVGQVHIGFVFLLHGHSNAISIKSELKGGQLLTLQECVTLLPHFETWSALVLQTLIEQKNNKKVENAVNVTMQYQASTNAQHNL